MAKKSAGFWMPELMVVVGTFVVIRAIAIPSVHNAIQSYRLAADAAGIVAQLHLARMRAASGFTKAEANFHTRRNAYQVEVWSKTASAYQPEGGAQPCGDKAGEGRSGAAPRLAGCNFRPCLRRGGVYQASWSACLAFAPRVVAPDAGQSFIHTTGLGVA